VVSVYTRAGGSYVVARENFGPRVAQVAAIALLIDYVVTVAVQTAAGSAAIVSAFPALSRIPVIGPKVLLVISVLAILLMCLGNLRGIRCLSWMRRPWAAAARPGRTQTGPFGIKRTKVPGQWSGRPCCRRSSGTSVKGRSSSRRRTEMPGIIVGVDGSGHSQRALEWAMKEAAIRHASLTVLTVDPAIVGYFGGVVSTPRDVELTEQVLAAVKEEADKVLAALDGPHPESVTVKAVHGFPVEELVNASKDADIVVLGSRGVGGFTRMLMGSTAGQVVQHAHCPVLIVPPEDRG
jgi:nucleotide-binding universal stress UspA family protein